MWDRIEKYPICSGNAKIYTEMERGEEKFLYYVCKHCGSIFIAPNIIKEMDEGKTLRSELQGRCII